MSHRARWTTLLALPLLVGAILVLHGLDSHAGVDRVGGTSAAAQPHEDDRPGAHDDEHCATCAAGHVVAACVAIMATVVGLQLARRVVGVLASTVAAATAAIRAARRELLRPPDPAWVRLAVMRC